MITVDILVACWIKNKEIKRYEYDLQILPTTKTTKISQYSDASKTTCLTTHQKVLKILFFATEESLNY